ncbi:hypothetical protein M431DRAFT_458460 [Trichoderma harzianum CBS 226.95]|uniref:Uncharacterized protein n=1 Tax=Trichoderma harzianum CBS 226.95 TaxID=983964 RepID=A0A2T4A7Y8_TRIHA|nr:hypothetical protein M431DRAFT_458460 [Trichoderma harzianum CBS 226.95]PTB53156.1 hypothetical protein M431DRAFT_458460 [Trichoderma harzianum CBS 226.95]
MIRDAYSQTQQAHTQTHTQTREAIRNPVCKGWPPLTGRGEPLAQATMQSISHSSRCHARGLVPVCAINWFKIAEIMADGTVPFPCLARIGSSCLMSCMSWVQTPPKRSAVCQSQAARFQRASILTLTQQSPLRDTVENSRFYTDAPPPPPPLIENGASSSDVVSQQVAA